MVDDIVTISVFGVPSLEVNAFINSKIKSKKLELNSKKYPKIHIGKRCNVNDVISKDGKNRKNIKSRTSRSDKCYEKLCIVVT